MIIYEMVTELGDIQELVAYSGNFDDMQTLLDCILDESTDNEHSISSILEHLEKSEVVKWTQDIHLKTYEKLAV